MTTSAEGLNLGILYFHEVACPWELRMYSQRDEEQYVLQVCEKAKRRRYLDIGAFDPKAMSNTRALYELGWCGVMVEPSPKCVRALVEGYGKADGMAVVSAAVALEPGLLAIQISDDAVSSSNASNIALWAERANYLGTLYVPVLTIQQILDRFGAFDMVSIDVEGGSVGLLGALLATEMMPACIVCEYDDKLAEAQMAAEKRGYRTIYTSNENIVLELVGT